jgi:bifunctional non-homologous end joining protein LigD
MTAKTMTIGGQEVEVSNLDKVLFPEIGLTKGDLIDYATRIADAALPHLSGRPLTMQRFPDGIADEGFYQKDVPDYFPDWIDRVELDKENGTVTHVVANRAATLVYLANQACITLHAALSRADRINFPDRLVFDLDPSDDDFDKVRFAALKIREALEAAQLVSFVQTTGSRGLHIVVPLDRSAPFDDVRAFAHVVGRHMAREHPDELTVEHRKSERGNRVFIDYLRNAYGQTSVAPYSVRARSGAPIATPLDWPEVEDDRLDPRKFSVGNIFRRLGQKDDPWHDIAEHAQSLDGARKALSL